MISRHVILNFLLATIATAAVTGKSTFFILTFNSRKDCERFFSRKTGNGAPEYTQFYKKSSFAENESLKELRHGLCILKKSSLNFSSSSFGIHHS